MHVRTLLDLATAAAERPIWVVGGLMFDEMLQGQVLRISPDAPVSVVEWAQSARALLRCRQPAPVVCPRSWTPRMTPRDPVGALWPDILVEGADYAGREVMDASGGRMALVPLLAGQSTTNLTGRIFHVHSPSRVCGAPETVGVAAVPQDWT